MLKVYKHCLGVLSITSLLFCGVLSAQAAENTIQITVPSQIESTIAPGRNFYVKGTFAELGEIPEGSTVSVTLTDSTGNKVRTISTDIKNNKNLSEDWITFHTDTTIIADTGMPDLIWDGVDSATIHNGDRKCFYNNLGFAAMIPGGKTAVSIDDKLNLTDSLGRPYEALAEGTYDLNITLSSPDGTVLGTQSKPIQIGITPHKILTRFSGAAHTTKFQQFASDKGYRVYYDPFPGYWSVDDIFCENAPEWRAADATEYTDGQVHFVIYNVKPTSTTYSVELGLLQTQGAIDTRLSAYYYSTGEPGIIGGVDSTIEQFDEGDKLQLTRAELSTEKQEDNLYYEHATSEPTYDMDVSDGVTVLDSQHLSIYGVTAPIQLDASDITVNEDNTFSVSNKIQTIHYEITSGKKTYTYDGDVSLNRVDGDYKNPSELEFKHVLPIDKEMVGSPLTVKVQGYDSHGNTVAGTEESFSLTVTSEQKDDPVADEPTKEEPKEEPPKKEQPNKATPKPVEPATVTKAVKTGDAGAPLSFMLLVGLFSLTIIISIKKEFLP